MDILTIRNHLNKAVERLEAGKLEGTSKSFVERIRNFDDNMLKGMLTDKHHLYLEKVATHQ